jgi:hypothetical protein
MHGLEEHSSSQASTAWRDHVCVMFAQSPSPPSNLPSPSPHPPSRPLFSQSLTKSRSRIWTDIDAQICQTPASPPAARSAPLLSLASTTSVQPSRISSPRRFTCDKQGHKCGFRQQTHPKTCDYLQRQKLRCLRHTIVYPHIYIFEPLVAR